MAKTPSSAPVVGISVDSEQPGGYSKYPWYALRQNYCSSVSAAGGVPIVLPHETALVERYAGMIDALIVTGGAFDVDPALFGDSARHPSVTVKEGRTDFELAMTRAVLAADKPILGICGGEQLLAVALGGTLIQHIPDEVPNALPHEQPNPRHEAGHDIVIARDTLLHRVAGMDRTAVNSAHHQSVKSVPQNIVINSRAPDGVIEGIEDPARKFCLGVQWHPEFLISPADAKIFAALVAACRT
ncbi:MAG: gamma-glutamyl-gamma-aminobutyrate hydrolase family protein [Rhodobacteraceae bacterium]|nr:gamma-glutamyl-gamma-aminobutyrate hydrolase family protein [Paracoccaceae bacterium]